MYFGWERLIILAENCVIFYVKNATQSFPGNPLIAYTAAIPFSSVSILNMPNQRWSLFSSQSFGAHLQVCLSRIFLISHNFYIFMPILGKKH